MIRASALRRSAGTMNVGVLGAGRVGQLLGRRLAGLGHRVLLGTRDPSRLDAPRDRAAPLRTWLLEAGDNAGVGTLAQAAAHSEMVFNATAGYVALEALRLAGEQNLAGKVLVDVSNPLDFSAGTLPTLFVKGTDSLGEQIQRAFPRTRVVKTLNTMSSCVMVDPTRVADGDHTVYLSGNDVDAKARVADVLRSFGWRDILDLGDITTARGTEMILPLGLCLSGVLGTATFNLKVAR